ncbi:MAG TPA: TolC family protein [Gammaproteobacteria bacterium]|nr:TolC family protein [Gammaproteobacteria bacterium]
MFLRVICCAGIYACLVLPVWAETSPQSGETPSPARADKFDGLAPFVERVWAESPAVRKAHAALEAARARAEGADRPLHNPQLELDAEQTGVNTTSLGLTQTIDWSDKRGALTRIAGQETLAAEAGLRGVRQRIAIETLEALVRYSTAREMLALAQRSSRLMEEFVAAVKQRREAGDVAALDVTLAEVAYSEALMEQAASEGELIAAEAALQAVSGLTLAQWPALPEEPAPPAQADMTLLDSLPELEIVRHRMEAARARIELARKRAKIDPTIGIRAGREESDELLGLSIGIPLFVRNNYQAGIRAASHQASAEEQAYRDARRRAAARLEGALGRFSSTSRAWEAWKATGQQALQRQRELLEQMWQARELTATDFLIQAKQNIDTQATASRLRNQVWQAAVAWLEASGQIERWLGLAERNQNTNTNPGETEK